eukprot:CAMPEP_0195060938 /NCGR_PEP_ID=MMETSP0448-20130528/8088_1 /TAXON_ID=66468 /ORGANISM="Heterocapsa triquestra, Strain CCMP 448" /LENGTH=111 /DNA_ID=CAMNT_0040091457 /DNA_START=150 /DNA_END=482 /DNA_ORIENTATION=+
MNTARGVPTRMRSCRGVLPPLRPAACPRAARNGSPQILKLFGPEWSTKRRTSSLGDASEEARATRVGTAATLSRDSGRQGTRLSEADSSGMYRPTHRPARATRTDVSAPGP